MTISRNICYSSWYRGLGGGELQLVDQLEASAIARTNVHVLINGEGRLAEVLRSGAYSVNTCRWDRGGNLITKNIAWQFASRCVRRFLRRVNPAVVFCNTFDDLNSVGSVAALQGIPLIWRGHADALPTLEKWPEKKRAAFFQLVNDHVERVICTTGYEASQLEDAGVHGARIITVPISVDVSTYADACGSAWLRERYEIPDELPVIGFAARMVPQKGFELFFDALAVLKSKDIDFFALLAGDTVLLEDDPERYKASLIGRVAELGIGEYTRFIGFCDRMPEFMGGLDIFAHASSREPFGITLVEAMAAGVPVVAADLAGPRESVVHGETGFLFEPGDAVALADYLERLLIDKTLRARFGMAGQKRVARFDARVNLPRIDAECQQFLG